ncbi:hypothetical protein OG394_02665 [Kribbella sp. NBC_01245]|uniref:hypothetical protein n=1 Tax=Kribbella sp. NBC_01245 TaxID=2903578 RepID=UPI002E2AF018|nr:hypothetical protein [Kribbella sp. NBC_01245]
MVKSLQNLGDRILGRFVPEVVAEAGVQDYQLYCYCQWDINRGRFVRWYKNCASGACGGCYPTVTGC